MTESSNPKSTDSDNLFVAAGIVLLVCFAAPFLVILGILKAVAAFSKD